MLDNILKELGYLDIEDKLLIKSQLGWPRKSVIVDYFNEDGTLPEELKTSGNMTYQEEPYMDVEFLYNEEQEIESIIINSVELEVCENLIIEVDINGEPRHVTFEWSGALAEDHEIKTTFKREQKFMDHKNRFNKASYREIESNPAIPGSDANLKEIDSKNNIRPGPIKIWDWKLETFIIKKRK